MSVMETPTRISAEALEAKYREEREKRFRPDGNAQYRELSEVYADLDHDPYSPPLVRDAVHEETDVVIVGAGLGGLMAAARLVQQGVTDIRVVDKAGDFGGTWYWNRYPGAACDIESYIYMPMLEETGYVPTEKYAKSPEIFEHCQRIGRQFDLYPKALFQTEVTDLSWDEGLSRWRLTTDRGDELLARFAIVAGGILHKPKLPGIPGIESFKGQSFHTSRWDYAYTGGGPGEVMDRLKDKRVALIGTGATSVQIVPKLAEAAGELTIFQRTPSGIGVRGNRPTDPDWASALQPGWQAERMENFTRIVSGHEADQDLVADGWTKIFQHNPAAMALATAEHQQLDHLAMEEIRGRIDAIVKDPVTAEALKPWYNQMCKRPCFHDDYLEAFNRPSVELVDTAGRGVDRITEDAVVVDGVSYPVDCIIYASGFEVSTSYQRRLGFEIHGRGGVGLADAWAEGPATLHGLLARGFPNLVMFSMTQGGYAINFAHLLGELAVHAAWYVSRCLKSGVEEAEPTVDAQEGWFQTLMANMGPQPMFYAQCTPSYMNAEGTREASVATMRGIPFFGGTLQYLQHLRDWRQADDLAGLEVRKAGENEPGAAAAPKAVGELDGRVVLLTGGAQGIGAGIAEMLAEAGATVVIADLDEAKARAKADALVKAGHKADALRLDLADERSVVEGCADVVARFGVPWALVNNAGLMHRELLLEATAAEWDQMAAVNTRAPFLMLREIGRAMAQAKAGGRIVTVGSAAITGCILDGHAAYAASKTALLGLTRAAAMELAPHQITVNMVLPGGVLTPGAMGAKGPSSYAGPALRPPPLGMCEPRDIAAAVLFLISPAARRVTNQALAVDAGWSVT